MDIKWSAEVLPLVQEALDHVNKGDVLSIMKACDALGEALETQPGDELLVQIRDGLLVQIGCAVQAAAGQKTGAISTADYIARARKILATPQGKKKPGSKTTSPSPRRRENRIEDIVRRVTELPEDFHLAGTVPGAVLNGIVKHCGLSIANSLETGSGKTTLLFSHLSKSHRVFAVEGSNRSITAVRDSVLLNKKTVKFIEGPTQLSLRQQKFRRKLQAVLIDGPHGYPFPELEYYYLYPHIENGGILIVDDIHIPTVHNLFAFLKDDEMWQLIEVIHNTAFFRRTDAPLFNPLGDGWNLQKYNSRRFPIQAESS